MAEVLERTRPDLLLFCGDGLRDLTYCNIPCPLYAVKGNCDMMPPPLPCVGGEIQNEVLIPLEGMTLLLMHGHKYGVKSGLGAAVTRAVARGADALIFGHTHIPLDRRLSPDQTNTVLDIPLSKPLHIFNPGSLYDRPHTFGTLTLRRGVPLFSHGQI